MNSVSEPKSPVYNIYYLEHLRNMEDEIDDNCFEKQKIMNIIDRKISNNSNKLLQHIVPICMTFSFILGMSVFIYKIQYNI